MKELLKESLVDYHNQYETCKAQALELIKSGGDYQAKIDECVGLKVIIETTILELKKYV